jgi:hypothetical protein
MQENCCLKKISPALLIFIFLSFSFLSNGIQEDFELNKTDEQLIQKFGNDYTTTEKQITFFTNQNMNRNRIIVSTFLKNL